MSTAYRCANVLRQFHTPTAQRRLAIDGGVIVQKVERRVFHIWASCGGFKYCCIPHPER